MDELAPVIIASPVGLLEISADEDALRSVRYLEKGKPTGVMPAEKSPVARLAALQLREYFAGKRKVFDVPLRWPRTVATQKILKCTAKIPAGETRSYAQVAASAGYPGAARAAGTALRNNPFAIVVPCHRVIHADGSLGRYAGRDDGRKEKLIEIDCL